MNIIHLTLSSHAKSLLNSRFERYVSEVGSLLVKVERRGWVIEAAQVRTELDRLAGNRSLPVSFSAFHDLARLQTALRRDVTVIHRVVSPKLPERRAAPTLPLPNRAILVMSSSAC
jgi:hypothetical protein